MLIVDRIELAKQTMDFASILSEYQPVLFKTARRTDQLLRSSVVVNNDPVFDGRSLGSRSA